MSKHNHTREQYLAIFGDRHMSVTANAGSGKTRVLVEKYLELLLNTKNKLEPKDILAITFTKKAAAEMQMRAVSQINELYQQSEKEDDLRKIAKLREKLTYSKISTIHSFCSNLIREYPIEAGISPSFAELDKIDETRIQTESINFCVESWLEDPNKEADIKYLYSVLGIDKVENYITILLSKREIINKFKDNYLDNYNRKTKEFIRPLTQKIISNLNVISEVMQRAIPNTSTQKNNIEFAKNGSQILLEKISEDYDYGIEDFLKIVIDYTPIKKKILTKSGTVIINFAKNLEDADVEYFEIELQSKILNDVLPTVTENSEEEFLKVIKILIDLFNDISEMIEEEKSELGSINFDDMLFAANDLLGIDEIAEKIRSDFKYILVDEFQDTNDLQYEIIQKLVPSLKSDTPDPNDPILFIVGDAKQSIYGFRDADVSVFTKAKHDINSINSKLIEDKVILSNLDKNSSYKCSNSENQGTVELNATFRLLPVVGAYVNEVCGNLMSAGEFDFQIDYNGFTIAREVNLLSKTSGSLDSELGSIDFLFSDEKAEEKQEESTLTANYIRQIVQNGKKKTTEGNPYRYGDFGILVRQRKYFNELSNEFIKQDIPFVINSGQGFFQTQEIKDILAYLRFITNPKDDISFASLLRSYFFGLQETYLFRIAKESRGSSFYDKFINFAANNPDDKFIQYIENTITNIAPNYYSSTISKLITSLIEHSNWHYLISSNPAKHQINANVEKMLKQARSFESRGFKHLFDFVNELNLLSESTDEQEAEFAHDLDAVNIMTIHSAKGLEFPIAILYRTNSGSKRGEDLYINKNYGLSFNIPYITDTGDSKSRTSLVHAINQYINTEKDDAEVRRLLYVAMTRAKDHLAISASFSYTTKDNLRFEGLLKLIQQSALIDINGLEWENDEAQVVLRSKINYLRNRKVEQKECKFPISFYRHIESIADDTSMRTISKSESKILVEDIAFEINKEVFSASKFMQFKHNQDQYKNRYFLGLPNSRKEYSSDTVTAVESLDSHLTSLEGTIIHRALENITKWMTPNGEIQQNKLKAIIESSFNSAERTDESNLAQRIVDECMRTAQKDLILRNYWALEDAESEFELTIPVGSHYLTGSFDLMVENSDKEYEIWDWKTNRIATKKRYESLVNQYELQMKIYAYLLSLHSPEQKAYKVRLLFTKWTEENWVHTFSWTKDELENFKQDIETNIKDIMSIF